MESMAWYYVQGKDRVGPVTIEKIAELFSMKMITADTFVWRKGFDNWQKAQQVDELRDFLSGNVVGKIEKPVAPARKKDIDWSNISPEEKIFNIKIGVDRGVAESIYGPYSLMILKKLAAENRINEKTYVFAPGMENWMFLGDLPVYKKYISNTEPQIEEKDRRISNRKPFVARMLFHDNTAVYEGVCRDISIGGLQVLVSNYPGKVGDMVTLNVHPDNSDICFAAEGKIVRVLEGGIGFSLRFEKNTPETERLIKTYLY